MCGIAGFIYAGSFKKNAAATAVRRMIAAQRHRGPDGEGFYDTAGAALGHCRLAIIDLSHAGRQPMPDFAKRFWITYNGEIYNYLELASELKALGHRFRGHSDTEVLLAAYQQWREKCLDRLRGMFAFAIWDDVEKRLFAARDRFGIKPFHYWMDSGRQCLAFASELKALLEFLPERRANLKLAQEFLAWNLLNHDAAETMVQGIHCLPPGHFFSWRPGEEIRLRRYWRLQISEALQTPASQRAEIVAQFGASLREAVSLHLRADVAVGTCLSGGLDSSSLVCLINAELRQRGDWRKERQHTFSACFAEPNLDERPYIEEVVRATECAPHFIFPRGEQMLDDVDAWLWHQEEPAGGTSAYAQYCVARLAREHGIKVLLDGQGADELLAGYRKFILVYLRQLLNRRQYLRAVSEALAFFLSPALLRTTSFVDGRRYLLNSLDEVNQLWPLDPPPRPAAFGLDNTLGRRLESDVTHFSLPVFLRYEDRNTMAFGVEARVPFVDHVFVEQAATLPADMRLSAGWTKRILREALIGVLPERVRTRKSKLGFVTPESKWLRGPLSGWLRETLQRPRHLDGVVERIGVQKLLGRFVSGERSEHLLNTLFRLAIYESWARRFLAPTPRAVVHEKIRNCVSLIMAILEAIMM